MRALLKYPGGKWSIAEWIVSMMPEHKFYLEPYFGSGAVFFNKPPVAYETINDIDGNVVNFFKACRNHPEELAEQIALTPWARDEYFAIIEPAAGESIKLTGDCVEDARRFCIRMCQAFGSKTYCRVGWKNTKHSSGPVNPKIWNKLPTTIHEAAERLKNVQIENRPAVELIRAHNAKDCLIYADPPYLPSTRKNMRIYAAEMFTEAEHIELLQALKDHTGPALLSGYESDIYNDFLKGWDKATISYKANSAEKKLEVLWMNFEAHRQTNMNLHETGQGAGLNG